MTGNRRALATTFGAGWLVLLALRLAMNAAGAQGRSILDLLVVVGPVTSVWLPIIAIVVWADRRSASRLWWHVPIAATAVMLEPWLTQQILGAVGTVRPYLPLLVGRFDTNVLIYAIIVVADRAMQRLEAFRAHERHAASLQQSLADAQLQALALQLQPHFLFNALQFVAETAHVDLAAARRTLGQLRGLVSQAFDLEQRLEVPLAEELAFLAAYAEIQKSRFGDRFNLSIQADDTALDAAVPPLILQPLVENAARHGFGARGSGGRITVTAALQAPWVVITVVDDGVGPPPQMREGQGLSVTRRRLERLHGSRATLAVERETDETIAIMHIPFRPASGGRKAQDVVVAEPVRARLEDERSDVPIGLRLIGFWCVLLMLVVGGTAVAAAFGPNRTAPFRLEGLIVDEIIGLPFWAMMTLAALVVGRRIGKGVIAAHAAIALALTFLHVYVGDYFLRDFIRGLFQDVTPGGSYLQWAVWDVLVYAALVIITRSHDLRDWIAAQAREEVVLSTEVVAVNRRLERLRQLQSQLLAELDDVIASPTMESLDRAVVEFAEFLRSEVMPDAVGVPAEVTA